MIGRRAILAGGATTLILPALAQTPGRTYRVGSLHIAKRDAPQHLAFRSEMARLGFEEGRNIQFDREGHELTLERFAGHARQLVAARVDAIYVGGDAAIAAAAAASATIPVLGVADDIVGSRYAASLSRPGRNITGFSVLAGLLDGKRMELLIELLPKARRFAALADRAQFNDATAATLHRVAQERNVALDIFLVGGPSEIAGAVEAAKAKGAQGLNVLATPLLFNHERILIETARVLRLPSMHQWPDSARSGGTAGYGPNMPEVYRTHVARIMARLLNGANPAEVPIEQPTRIEFVINRKVAEAQGVELSSDVLARADEVIE